MGAKCKKDCRDGFKIFGCIRQNEAGLDSHFFFREPRQPLENSWRAGTNVRDGLWLHSGQLISSRQS